MRTFITILSLTLITTITLKAQAFKTEQDSLSYSLGILVADNLKNQGFGDIDVDLFAKAMKAYMKGEETLMTTAQCQGVVQENATKKTMKAGESNKIEGEAFLAKNKLRPEVTTLPDGLQYEILKSGDGPKPKETDKVLVHYHGTLINGQIFDSSVQRGEPIAFPLNQVIKGWTEVVQLMPVGSKWKVYIPYQLAYGERGAGGSIGPYSALIFEIELLEIQ
jgi:FKBP-type peptidyl-prolyl cis-trans isomerase FklB